ncbi:MAG: hypothetical protein A4E53_04533 [Pelotomaculum sp. PtaB.Bin104]|nr:MAG: hypothetical protein A4E53_04533 [Pelotomaculum sp. PtaB.Bin104]
MQGMKTFPLGGASIAFGCTPTALEAGRIAQGAHHERNAEQLHVLHLQEARQRGMQFPLHPGNAAQDDYSG